MLDSMRWPTTECLQRVATQPMKKAKGYPFEVRIPDGLPVEGVVLSDQAKSLDWRARGAEPACALPPESTLAVLRRLETLVGV